MNIKDIEFLNTLLEQKVEFIFAGTDFKYIENELSKDDIKYYADFEVSIDTCSYDDNTKTFNIILSDKGE